jgi:hypothetical protein
MRLPSDKTAQSIDSESCTGIDVVAGFSGIARIINWPHGKMAALVLGRRYLQML